MAFYLVVTRITAITRVEDVARFEKRRKTSYLRERERENRVERTSRVPQISSRTRNKDDEKSFSRKVDPSIRVVVVVVLVPVPRGHARPTCIFDLG